MTIDPIEPDSLRRLLEDPACGAFVAFEGRVRNHHNGSRVLRLEYEAYPSLAISVGSRILDDLKSEFGLGGIRCVHRTGALVIGEIAVWVGAVSPHRREAFEAVAKAMSLIKRSVPIWKHEFYLDGGEAWVHCSHDSDPGTHCSGGTHSRELLDRIHSGASPGMRPRKS